jgi:hypothetical protein
MHISGNQAISFFSITSPDASRLRRLAPLFFNNIPAWNVEKLIIVFRHRTRILPNNRHDHYFQVAKFVHVRSSAAGPLIFQ